MLPTSRDDFTIAVFCALTLEADAVEELFDETYDTLSAVYGKQPGDPNAYINGRIGKHNVVLCHMPGMGQVGGASVFSSLRVSYTQIQVALIVGICGGAPYPSGNEQIFLGDVIISDAVIEYDLGRQYPDGFQRKTDVKDILRRPNQEIRTLLAMLRARRTRRLFEDKMLQHLDTIQQMDANWSRPADDILFEASYQHKHYGLTSSSKCLCFDGNSPNNICKEALETICSSLGCDENKILRCRHYGELKSPAIHIGTIASSNTLMKSGENRDSLFKLDHVIGFEIEGARVWEIEGARVWDNASCIIIKGVCDYADSHKNKSWQAYAAATGASAAKAFLEYLRPADNNERKCHLMIPFRRNPYFIARHHEINRLMELLSAPDGPTKIAITGLGGIGKTQIALELAYVVQDIDPGCSIFWIQCTSYETIEKAYMTIARSIGLQGGLESGEIKEEVKKYLSQKSSGKWLLILDNADDVNMWIQDGNEGPALKDYLPESKQGHVLFTTRNRKLAVRLAGPHTISLPKLDANSAMKLLETLVVQKHLLLDYGTVSTFLELLAFLPLAIVQAAAYINENDIGLSDYLILLQDQESEVVELLSEDFKDEWRYIDIQNPVATTWLISFHQIQKLDQLAAHYLFLIACVNPKNIPQSFLPMPTGKKKKIDALGLLSAYSFITVQVEDGSLNLHRLVRLAIRNWLRNQQQFSFYISEAADELSADFPDNDHTNRKRWREYLPHALSLIGESEFRKKEENYNDFLRKVAQCLYSDGRYSEAEALFHNILSIQQRKYGDENLSTLSSMAKLASTYMRQGRLNDAERLQMHVMKALKRLLGPEHPDTLTSTDNLASTYMHQGRLNESEELQVHVIETRKRVLGPEHPDTLTSMDNLASIYIPQGRLNEAEELQVHVTEARKHVLGPEHPDTLTSMDNLASTYMHQGRLNEAEELQVHVTEARKHVLGPEHPDTLTSMDNLASTYIPQGRLNEAEELQVHVIETRKQVLGPEHPDTLTSMDNLASTYIHQGRLNEAEKLQVHVTERVLRQDHPHLQASMSNAASMPKSQELLDQQAECSFAGTTIVGMLDENTLEVKSLPSLVRAASDSAENEDNEDCISVESIDDDIASQVATRRTQPEIFAVRQFGSFLGELKELRPLHEEALRKLGSKRFQENYRKILKIYVLRLRNEAQTPIEKDTIRVLKSRFNRISIAQRILALIQEDKENSTQPLDELISKPVEQQSLEDWAKNAYGPPLADSIVNSELEGYEQSSDDGSDSEDAEDKAQLQFPNITHANRFLHRGIPFQILVFELRLLVLPLSLREVIESVPKCSIHISSVNDTSFINMAKAFVENYTASAWDWWPLKPRVPELPLGRLRLEWRFCGETLYREISLQDGDSIQQILELIGDHNPSKCVCCETKAYRMDWTTFFQNARQSITNILNWKARSYSLTEQASSSVAQQRYTPEATVTASMSLAITPGSTRTSPTYSSSSSASFMPAPAGNSGIISTTRHSDPLWVIFGIKDAHKLDKIENIEISNLLNDPSFFRELKRRYAKHCWFFQHWFSPVRFRYCKFVQFETINFDQVYCSGEALPDDHGHTSYYEYHPRPPKVKNPLISRELFAICLKACDTDCHWAYLPSFLHKCRPLPHNSHKWKRIPRKKGNIFDASLSQPGETVFGIEAAYALSFATLFVYHVALLSLAFGFWIYWLKNHPDDLQNASVPSFTVLALIGAFWGLPGRRIGDP